MDYNAWLRRCERFVRSTSELPGKWGMEVAIEPTIDEHAANQLAKSLRYGLPDALRVFYVTASANALCRYWWQPNEDLVTRLQGIFPYERSVYGGGRICPAAELVEAQDGFDGWAEVFEDYGEAGRNAAAIVRGSLPLLAVGNGDHLALHMKANQESPPVIYISHEADLETDQPITTISETFEDFLMIWEELCYVGPEIWLLGRFVENSSNGRLRGDSTTAESLRELLEASKIP